VAPDHGGDRQRDGMSRDSERVWIGSEALQPRGSPSCTASALQVCDRNLPNTPTLRLWRIPPWWTRRGSCMVRTCQGAGSIPECTLRPVPPREPGPEYVPRFLPRPRHRLSAFETSGPERSRPYTAGDCSKGNDWRFELKADGYRAQTPHPARGVKVHSRTGLDWTDQFSS
jgi:hypothetical protein